MRSSHIKQERPRFLSEQASLPNDVTFCGALIIALNRCCEASSFYLMDKLHDPGRTLNGRGGASW